MRIGFLFNHDQTHQLAHALPIALELIANHPEVEVVIATSNDRMTSEVRHLAMLAGVPVTPVQLSLKSRSVRLAARAFQALLPLSKICIYRENLDFFRSLDALVVTEKTSLLLKSRYKLEKLKLIHTRHGAGDRAIGFEKASALFDHVLVSGPKIRDRLAAEAGVPREKMSMVGYPKFDTPPPRAELSFSRPELPTILYNPHCSPHLSSWYRHGQAVLDYFLRDGRFNLIFAPHVMMFHRPFVVSIDKLRIERPGKIDRRYFDAPNIHIDLGSRASTDMTYTNAADLYLGDVSSQVYEFLRTPRPCLFIDSHETEWRDNPNYAHWQAGDVIRDVSRLGSAIDQALATHDRYRPAQKALFDSSFDLGVEPSSKRAARAILGVLSPVAPTPIFGKQGASSEGVSEDFAVA